MSRFYKDMLSHEQFSIFFKNQIEIDNLIEKQKRNFIDSLNDTPQQLQARYLRLGELHYNLRVPSSDFLKSTRIWRGCFIDYAIDTIKSTKLVQDIESYFKKVDSWMSNGYLKKQLEVDKDDLEKLINHYKNIKSGTSDQTLDHLNWLLQILIAIQSGSVKSAPELDVEKCSVHPEMFCSVGDADPIFTKEHFDDLHHRLHIDARSLFYFIDINDYIEVLSLYSSLLSVYKITLVVLGNANLHQTVKMLEQNLSDAKEEVKQLRGILPICSHCKKIRDDKGFWNHLEEFISERTEAEFSHGICDKCVSEHYSGFSR
ncbi:MAG: hypothetical protein HQM13_07150 [SAR324 cluster bacterium]|nr:hypothetical protein [SAR324 cluster bacterium]